MIKRGTLALVCACAYPLAAQVPTDATLASAMQLVTEGQGDSARALVRARLRQVGPSDSLYPEVLFIAGVVADNADSALAAFRRVSIEFSQSAWADHALLRIAQLHFAAGDLTTATRAAERILLDYPMSPVGPAAAYWVARVRLERGELSEACDYLQRAATSEDVELANRAAYYFQRCRDLARPDTAARDTAAATPRAGATAYAVQVAAVETASAADAVMRTLTAAGFTPRVVREGGFFKVRVGRFRTRGDADRVRAQVRDKLGGSPFVVEEQ
ncbi:MAG TPA: SPOR domain-containing protein [Gemmatimonadales bacterium]